MPGRTHETWGSRNAEDMFAIATRLAGFNAADLMFEIHKRTRPGTLRVNEPTVLNAMQVICDRCPEYRKARAKEREEAAHVA